MRATLLVVFLLVLLALPHAHTASAADVTTLKGEKLVGDLIALNDRELVLRVEGREQVVPLADLLAIQLRDPGSASLPKQFIDVELVDGSMLRGSAAIIKGKKLHLVLVDGREMTIDVPRIAYVLNNAQDPIVRKAFDAVYAERVKSDRFFVRRDSRLDGLEGTFGDGSEDGKSIAFTTKDGESRRLPQDRLAALMFNNRLEGNVPPTLCRIGDVHGNRLNVQRATLADGKLQLVTVGGLTLEFPQIESIAALDFSKDKVIYLSDLKPADEDRGFDELPVVVARDGNLDFQPIQMEGRVYSRGLTLHAPIALTFDLNAEYKEFQAVVGVDSSVQTPSHVRLIIEGDGRPLLQTEVKAKESPKPVNLDVRKVRQFTIRVEQAAGLPFGHQLTLADARVTK